MTVDREARDQLAVDLRRLVTGRMINDEFDDRYYCRWKGSQDLVVSEIAKFAWGLYGSDRSYRLKGRYAVSPEVRRTAARAILFLRTNLAYQWPIEPEINLLWLLLPGCYLLLWIAALWGCFVSRLSDAWIIVFVSLAAAPLVYWLVGRLRSRKERMPPATIRDLGDLRGQLPLGGHLKHAPHPSRLVRFDKQLFGHPPGAVAVPDGPTSHWIPLRRRIACRSRPSRHSPAP